MTYFCETIFVLEMLEMDQIEVSVDSKILTTAPPIQHVSSLRHGIDNGKFLSCRRGTCRKLEGDLTDTLKKKKTIGSRDRPVRQADVFQQIKTLAVVVVQFRVDAG
jgi:hypothetical protein